MLVPTLSLILGVIIIQTEARTPRNCGLACNSFKKCTEVLDGSGGNRPGQLGNTGIIVLETCAPKLAKAKKKGCDCEEELAVIKDDPSNGDKKVTTTTQRSFRHSATQRPQPSTKPASRTRPKIRPFRAPRLSTPSLESKESPVSTTVRNSRRNLFGSRDRKSFRDRFRRRH